MVSIFSLNPKYKTLLGLILLIILTVGTISMINREYRSKTRDSYPIQTISIEADTQSDFQTNAKLLENSSIKFAQITDIHSTVYRSKSFARFENAVEEINSRNLDFVIITGDFVDWSAPPNWENFYEICKKIEPPVFTIPGNHDYRKNLLNVLWAGFPVPAWKPDNDKALNYYYEHLTPALGDLPENFSIDFGPSKGDFSFDYGSVRMVFLDSGHDVLTREFGVQASGLSDSQINWLEKDLKKEENIFIAMHHPVFNDKNLGISICITSNRENFLNILKKQDVIALLSGHSHTARSFEYQGVTHLQTDTPPSFRIITFDNNELGTTVIGQSYEAEYSRYISWGKKAVTGIQWTYLDFLGKFKTLAKEPRNFLILGIIILAGSALLYTLIITREKTR